MNRPTPYEGISDALVMTRRGLTEAWRRPALLVMAFVLAGSIGHLGPGNVTVKNGIISGLILWAGFVVTTVFVNNAYPGRKYMLSVLDSIHWLGVLVIQGAVIGAMGV